MRTLLKADPNFIAHFEQVENHTVIHLEVHKYNKTIKKQLLENLATLMATRTEPLLTVHTSGDEKHRKFLEMMGFELLINAPCSDGKKHDIYILDNPD